MRVRPYKGRFLSRRNANYINDMLLSSKTPDRTALKKEADEFIEYIKKRRLEKNKQQH